MSHPMKRNESARNPAPSQTEQGPTNRPSGSDPHDTTSTASKTSHSRSLNQAYGLQNIGSPPARQGTLTDIRPGDATGSDLNAGSRSDKLQDADRAQHGRTRAELFQSRVNDDRRKALTDGVGTKKMHGDPRTQAVVAGPYRQCQDYPSLVTDSKAQGMRGPLSLQYSGSDQQVSISESVTGISQTRSGKGSVVPSSGPISEPKGATAVTEINVQQGLQESEQEQLQTEEKISEETRDIQAENALHRNAARRNALASPSFSADQNVSAESKSKSERDGAGCQQEKEEHGTERGEGKLIAQNEFVSHQDVDQADQTEKGKATEMEKDTRKDGKNNKSATEESLTNYLCPSLLEEGENYSPLFDKKGPTGLAMGMTSYEQEGSESYSASGERTNLSNTQKSKVATSRRSPISSSPSDENLKVRETHQNNDASKKYDENLVGNDSETTQKVHTTPLTIQSQSISKGIATGQENRPSIVKNSELDESPEHSDLDNSKGSSGQDEQPGSNPKGSSVNVTPVHISQVGISVSTSLSMASKVASIKTLDPHSSIAVSSNNTDHNATSQTQHMTRKKRGNGQDAERVDQASRSNSGMNEQVSEAGNLKRGLEESNDFYCVEDLLMLEVNVSQDWLKAVGQSLTKNLLQYLCKKYHCEYDEKKKNLSGSLHNVLQIQKVLKDLSSVDDQTSRPDDHAESFSEAKKKDVGNSASAKVDIEKMDHRSNFSQKKSEGTKPGVISHILLVDSDVHLHIVNKLAKEFKSLISRNNCEITTGPSDGAEVKIRFEAAEKHQLQDCVTQCKKLIEGVVVKEHHIPRKVDIGVFEAAVQYDNHYPSVSIQFNHETRMCKILGYPQDDVIKTHDWINEIMICTDGNESSSVNASPPPVCGPVPNKKEPPLISKVKGDAKLIGGLNGNNSGKQVQVHSPKVQSAQKHKQSSLSQTPTSQSYSPGQGSQSSQPTPAVSGLFPIFINHESNLNNIFGFMISNQRIVQVVHDDMLKPYHIRNVAVIVSPCDHDMKCVDGLAKHIMDIAGQSIKSDCRDHVSKLGPIQVSGLVRTTPGNLKNQYSKLDSILHAVGPNRKDSKLPAEIIIQTRDTYLNCLLHANDVLTEASIAIPLLGAGMYKVSVQLTTEAAFSALLEFERHLTGIDAEARKLREIYFVSNNAASIKEMVQEFKRLIALNPPTKESSHF